MNKRKRKIPKIKKKRELPEYNPVQFKYTNMLDLSKKLKHSMPYTQFKATDIICDICTELHIPCPTVEKVLYCPESCKYYIGDIYFGRYKLLIEIDGSSHKDKKKYDKERDRKIRRELGIRTIRFHFSVQKTQFFRDEIRKILKREETKFRRRCIKTRKKNKKPRNT